jgi:O-antigen/teichoic acid export membrane protein
VTSKVLRAYLSQAYVTLVSILFMPILLKQVGAEAFGLIGFFLMLQAWTQIADLGAASVLLREMARFTAGAITAEDAVACLRGFALVQAVMAAAIAAAIVGASGWIATEWLGSSEFSAATVARCVVYIGFAVALRWATGLYRSALVGLGRLDRVNTLSAIFATVRFAGAVPFVVYVSNDPESFFQFQVAVSSAEFCVFAWSVRDVMPRIESGVSVTRALIMLLPMLKSMSFLTVIWIGVSQVDRLVLSGLLSLHDYGHFTLAVAAAGGVLVFAIPFNQTVQPRLIALADSCDEVALAMFYRSCIERAAIGFVALGAGVAFFAEPILRMWTGSEVVAVASAPVLFWYGLNNAVVGVLAMPFMLQFAKGRLRLHVIGNILLLFTLVPAVIAGAIIGEARGAGAALFSANLAFLLFWVPLVHRRFIPTQAWQWPCSYVFPVAIAVAFMLWVGASVMPDGLSVIATLAWILVSVIVAMGLGGAVAEGARAVVGNGLRQSRS